MDMDLEWEQLTENKNLREHASPYVIRDTQANNERTVPQYKFAQHTEQND